MTKRETAIKLLNTATKAADNVANELAVEILVVSGLGLVSSFISAVAAAILEKGGDKKKES